MYECSSAGSWSAGQVSTGGFHTGGLNTFVGQRRFRGVPDPNPTGNINPRLSLPYISRWLNVSCRLARHATITDCRLALVNAGISIAISSAMIPITTSSSTSVNARPRASLRPPAMGKTPYGRSIIALVEFSAWLATFTFLVGVQNYEKPVDFRVALSHRRPGPARCR